MNILFFLLSCYKHVKILEEMKEVEFSTPIDQSYCSVLETEIELRPQKYVGDKYYTPKTMSESKNRLVADVSLPSDSQITSLQIIPRAELNGAKVNLSLIPTALENKEGNALEISMVKTLSSQLSDDFNTKDMVEFPILSNDNLSSKRRRLRIYNNDPFVFRIEVDSQNLKELLKVCNGVEGCPIKVQTVYKNRYPESLFKVMQSLDEDMLSLDAYLNEQANGKKANFTPPNKTTNSINNVKNNYARCLTKEERQILNDIQASFEQFIVTSQKLWVNGQFEIVSSKTTIASFENNLSYINDNIVNVIDSTRKIEFIDIYNSVNVPHLYEQLTASQTLFDYDQKLDKKSFYLGDNLGWACWVFAQPTNSHSKCYKSMKSLNDLSIEKKLPISQIAADKIDIIRNFMTLHNEGKYPLKLETFAGVEILRYSKFEEEKNRLCYGSGSTIPSKDIYQDEQSLLNSVVATTIVHNYHEFEDWSLKIKPILRFVCKKEDISVPTIDINLMEKELQKMDRLSALHDFLEPWLSLQNSLQTDLTKNVDIMNMIEERIGGVVRIVHVRAIELTGQFRSPTEYREQFCNMKAHSLMRDMLKESRDKIVPSVNDKYSSMIRSRMLEHGVDNTLKEIGASVCSVNQEDSFFDCLPKIEIDLSNKMNSGCEQSKCIRFKQDVEALKKRSSSDKCFNVTGNVECVVPVVYPSSGIVSDAPWQNTGEKQIGTQCFQCMDGENVSIKLSKQGFAGDRYIIYSASSFKVNGNTSSTGNCKTVKQKDINNSCSTKILSTSGSVYTFDLMPLSDYQCFYIEGI